MKVGIFQTVTGGIQRFVPFKEKYKNDLEFIYFDCPSTYENLDRLEGSGCEALIYFNPKREDDAFFEKLSKAGIRYLSTTSAGYDHFNLEAMKKYGIKGANVPVYSPNAIAEHTVMLLLSMLRNYREQILRIEQDHYAIDGTMGKEVRNQVIGVIGAGRIGATTIQCLSGFHPKKILAYDIYENPLLKDQAEYVDFDSLLEKSDVIIFHCTATKENYHMINENSIKKMKDGVILINAARGSLLDNKAVLKAVETGKIGGLGIDVIEGEEKLKGSDPISPCPIPELKELLEHPNVVYTHHTAFYTDEAYRNLTETAIDNLLEYAGRGSCDRELVK